MRRKKRQCTYKDHKTWYSQVWHFLWHEDTWLSFAVDALLIIIIGKFILFPMIGLCLGTGYPAVAVISDSMDHQGQGFDQWWEGHKNTYESYNITQSEFEDFSFKNGFNKGDILIVKGKDKYEIGDVIVYSTSSRQYPIIHRVVQEDLVNYATFGDANSGQLAFEKSIGIDQIHGKAILKVPHLGWVKVFFVELFN